MSVPPTTAAAIDGSRKPRRRDQALAFPSDRGLFGLGRFCRGATRNSRQNDERMLISATERVRRAAIEGAGAEIDRLGKQLGDPAMRTSENLTATRILLEALFNEALPHLPEAERAGCAAEDRNARRGG
jgi:hypothetical protein